MVLALNDSKWAPNAYYSTLRCIWCQDCL